MQDIKAQTKEIKPRQSVPHKACSLFNFMGWQIKRRIKDMTQPKKNLEKTTR